MSDQRTLKESGLPELLGRMVEDAASKYNGGIPGLELVKGHPEFKSRIYGLFDVLSAERAEMLPLIDVKYPFLWTKLCRPFHQSF